MTPLIHCKLEDGTTAIYDADELVYVHRDNKYIWDDRDDDYHFEEANVLGSRIQPYDQVLINHVRQEVRFVREVDWPMQRKPKHRYRRAV